MCKEIETAVSAVWRMSTRWTYVEIRIHGNCRIHLSKSFTMSVLHYSWLLCFSHSNWSVLFLLTTTKITQTGFDCIFWHSSTTNVKKTVHNLRRVGFNLNAKEWCAATSSLPHSILVRTVRQNVLFKLSRMSYRMPKDVHCFRNLVFFCADIQ